MSGTKRTVTASNLRQFAIHAVAILALVAGVSSLAQATQRVGSDISLVVNGGQQVAVLPVITETAQDDLLTYDFATGEVDLAAGVLAPDYDEPLFCFDMGTPQAAVSLQVTDPNGHVIIDNFDLSVSLDYVLSAPSAFEIKPALNQQCFFRSDQGVFGLFGMENDQGAVGSDVIARDRFEVDRSISLEFQGVPTFVTPGETVNYDLVLTNTGSADLTDVALQELFPENLDVYAAVLSAGTWSCSASGDAVCPATVPATDPLRFEQMNAGGVDITTGDSLTFSIERTVDVNSITGESIRLQAGAVADPISSDTPFDVDEALMTVIGQSAGLNVSATSASADSFATSGTASDDAQITVTVLDSGQNPVPNEQVSLDSAGGLTITSPTSGTSDANGEVSFSGTAEDAGDYTVSFTSGSLNGSGTVTILAGAPDTFFLQETVPSAVADGQDTIEVQVLVEDQYGNAVDTAMVEVSDDDGLASLPASEFTDIDGIAAFNATSTTIGVFQPVFSVSGVGTSAASVSFEAGAPDDLEFTLQPPDPVTADVDFDVSLQVVDSQGNHVSDDQSTFVTLNLQQNGNTVRTLTSGSVTNGEITLTIDSIGPADIGAGYRIQAVASGTGFFGANSNSFEVVAGP